MHPEFYRISSGDFAIIKEARHRKARIFSCGTTTLRTLETCAGDFTRPVSGAGDEGDAAARVIEGFTSLYIYPGYEFKMADLLITNFHLPRSTLILLTSAFAGKELLFKAYRYAIEKKFRFFSYGDAMLII
ncbi:MAG: hypothetical protein A2Z72_08520 [Omnitrophica bacterium RBG_13_46_9]|nr:MAG: hypothetical protein A2Z72_08520 [Omnitrophica bacterium RBG_13_46_9]